MLKGIDPLLNAELLHALAAMGHGDELAIVDRNFPASALGRRVVRLDGTDTEDAARAILSVLPVDTFVERPVARMEVVGRQDEVPPVQANFLRLVEEAEQRPIGVESLSRQAFYERTRSVYVVVTTGELRPYGCFLIVKGVILAVESPERRQAVPDSITATIGA
ncbi:MAG: RbsD/FucU domain-containing protein [Gaiellaceae bacterium]|jgi:L-fucose mutarotase